MMYAEELNYWKTSQRALHGKGEEWGGDPIGNEAAAGIVATHKSEVAPLALLLSVLLSDSRR